VKTSGNMAALSTEEYRKENGSFVEGGEEVCTWGAQINRERRGRGRERGKRT